VKKMTGGVDWLTMLPTYGFNDAGEVTALLGSHWMWPIGTLLTFGGGLLGAKMKW
jgi:hypothetical protein